MSEAIFGLELEAAVSSNVRHATQVGSYHHGKTMPVKGWKAETDATVRPSGELGLDYAIEMVSAPARKATLMQRVDALISWLKEFGEFSDVIDFNESTGCHIHFSYGARKDDRWVQKYMQFYNLVRLRTRTIRRICKELGDTQASLFSSHYYRAFAHENDNGALHSEKYVEFNYKSSSTKGLEWRSFNLLGVKSWEAMRKTILIGLEELERVLAEMEEVVRFSITKRELAELQAHGKDVRETHEVHVFNGVNSAETTEEVEIHV